MHPGSGCLPLSRRRLQDTVTIPSGCYRAAYSSVHKRADHDEAYEKKHGPEKLPLQASIYRD
jgi:hypothetical protein